MTEILALILAACLAGSIERIKFELKTWEK